MSALSDLLPLFLLVLALTVAAAIAYIIYSVATEVAAKTSQKMEEKNVVFSKEGMRVGVREVRGEDYVGKTQRYDFCCGGMGKEANVELLVCWSKHGIFRRGRRIRVAFGIRRKGRPMSRCRRGNRMSSSLLSMPQIPNPNYGHDLHISEQVPTLRILGIRDPEVDRSAAGN